MHQQHMEFCVHTIGTGLSFKFLVICNYNAVVLNIRKLDRAYSRECSKIYITIPAAMTV